MKVIFNCFRSAVFYWRGPAACMLSAMLIGSLFACGTMPVSARTADGLEAAVKEMSAELVRQGNLTNRCVIVGSHDFSDAVTRRCMPLSNRLRGIFMAEMKQRGVRVLLPGADEEVFMILQGNWKKENDRLCLTSKVIAQTEMGPEAIAGATSTILMEAVDPGDLEPDRASHARDLVRKLESNMAQRVRNHVYLGKLQVRGTSGELADFGSYLAGWLRPALAESPWLIPVDETRAMRGIPTQELRMRGIYATNSGKTGPANLGLTAALTNANAALKGEAWFHREKGIVEVHTRIVDNNNVQITAAAADIRLDQFPEELMKPAPAVSPATQPIARTGSGVSTHGMTVELATDAGDVNPVYHYGETIRFVLRSNRHAYFYLFNISPDNTVNPLFPVYWDNYDQLKFLPRSRVYRFEPSRPVVLPDDGDSLEAVVDTPYGTDTVLAVACEEALDLPDELTGDLTRGGPLLTYIRDQGLSRNSGYAEATISITTRP